jgi:hypothetical protein
MSRVMALTSLIGLFAWISLFAGIAALPVGWDMQPISAGAAVLTLGGLSILTSAVLFIGWGILSVLLEPYRERAERDKLIHD